MFAFHKKRGPTPIDMTGKEPVIRSSICTGEQVAGVRDLETKKFSEVMAIRNRADLDEFLRLCGADESDVKREW